MSEVVCVGDGHHPVGTHAPGSCKHLHGVRESLIHVSTVLSGPVALKRDDL